MMGRTVAGMALVALALATAATAVDAQGARPRHEGFTGAFGVGYGKVKTTCTECSFPANETASHATARVGWALSNMLAIGVEALVLQKQQEDAGGVTANTNYVAGSAVVLIYPSDRYGFFLRAGGGIAKIEQSLDTFLGLRDLEATVPVGRIGAGWDMQFGRNWSLTPFADFLLGSQVESNVPNVKMKPTLFSFGIAFTLH